MKEKLHLTYIQSTLYWENIQANLAQFEELLWQMPEPTDLIVLPEMFTTGFSMNAPQLAEPMNLTTFKWMRQMAQQTGACITGSFIASENKKYYNRLLFMQPDGQYASYDKRHLFSMAKETEVYSPGAQNVEVTCKGWKIRPLVCYDLRFPVWSRNNATQPYDLLIYVANWPKPRVSAWDVLLPARAIENACYTLGVNRIGDDGNGIPHVGHSQVVDFKGQQISYAGDAAGIYQVGLERAKLLRYREKFPVLNDADDFGLKL